MDRPTMLIEAYALSLYRARRVVLMVLCHILMQAIPVRELRMDWPAMGHS